METQTAQDTLEAMIDVHGLAGVLFMVAEIAQEKGQHIEENWQDRITARPWFNAAKRVEAVASKFGI